MESYLLQSNNSSKIYMVLSINYENKLKGNTIKANLILAVDHTKTECIKSLRNDHHLGPYDFSTRNLL